MAKEIASAAVEPELLARIDAVAESRGEARSRTVARMLRNAIEQEELTLKGLESPMWGSLLNAVVQHDGFRSLIESVVREKFEPAVLERLKAELPDQLERGKERRQQAKNTGRKKK